MQDGDQLDLGGGHGVEAHVLGEGAAQVGEPVAVLGGVAVVIAQLACEHADRAADLRAVTGEGGLAH